MPYRFKPVQSRVPGRQTLTDERLIQRQMALEAIFISALFLTHLTIPSQFLKAFRLHFISYPFWCSDFSFSHFIILVLISYQLEMQLFTKLYE